MRGFIIGYGGVIIQEDLHFVDSFDDLVRDSQGQLRKRGEWCLLLDTARDMALKHVEKTIRIAQQIGIESDVAQWKRRLREMRGEGLFEIRMKEVK